MIDLVEDAQGMTPRPAGGYGITRVVLSVAEVIQSVSFVETIR